MDHQTIALLMGLLPILGLGIVYAVHLFRHGNVDQYSGSSDSLMVAKGEIEGLRDELAALRAEVGALRDTISSLNCDSGRAD